jgi:hypothetical protein
MLQKATDFGSRWRSFVALGMVALSVGAYTMLRAGSSFSCQGPCDPVVSYNCQNACSVFGQSGSCYLGCGSGPYSGCSFCCVCQ